jgi:flagellar biosynthetic protein FliR
MEVLQLIADVALNNFDRVFPIFAILTRISVFVFLLPGLGETAISVRTRLVVALMITWLIVPIIGLDTGEDWNINTLLAIVALEAFYGFVLGFGLRLMVFALQISGSIVSQSLSLTQVFGGGMTSEPNTSVGTILMMGGVTLLVTLDLHTRAVGFLLQSYETFPLASAPDLEKIAYGIAQKSMWVFSFSVSLALPFLVLNFIYNLMLGFVNKAMPQLMVSFVGMPFITGVGIVLLALSIAGILTVWLASFNTQMADFL